MTNAEYERFEGISDPDDTSILYAIETRNGVRGTSTDPYDVYADPSIADFIAGVPVRRDDSHRPLDCGTLNRTGRVSP